LAHYKGIYKYKVEFLYLSLILGLILLFSVISWGIVICWIADRPDKTLLKFYLNEEGA